MAYVDVSNRQITLPKSLDGFLRKGSRFLMLKSEDSIIFKQVRYPDFIKRAKSSAAKPPMTMEEICDIVRVVRRESYKKK